MSLPNLALAEKLEAVKSVETVDSKFFPFVFFFTC